MKKQIVNPNLFWVHFECIECPSGAMCCDFMITDQELSQLQLGVAWFKCPRNHELGNSASFRGYVPADTGGYPMQFEENK